MSEEIRLIRLPEKEFVGLPVTSAFALHEPERIAEVRRQFFDRLGEIRHAVDLAKFNCVSFTSEVLFTYIHCLEVGEIEAVPAGMIGFTVPARSYVVIRSKGDPYEAAQTYLARIGRESDGRALFWEEYRFEDPTWPDEAFVYVPLKEEPAVV